MTKRSDNTATDKSMENVIGTKQLALYAPSFYETRNDILKRIVSVALSKHVPNYSSRSCFQYYHMTVPNERTHPYHHCYALVSSVCRFMGTVNNPPCR